MDTDRNENKKDQEKPPASNESVPKEPATSEPPREIDGRDGLEPTRYGDWEKAGRCIDF